VRHRCCPIPNQEEIDRRNCRHGHQRLSIITLLYNRLFVYGLVSFCTIVTYCFVHPCNATLIQAFNDTNLLETSIAGAKAGCTEPSATRQNEGIYNQMACFRLASVNPAHFFGSSFSWSGVKPSQAAASLNPPAPHPSHSSNRTQEGMDERRICACLNGVRSENRNKREAGYLELWKLGAGWVVKH
jgi:hypothetical protein